MVLQTSTKVDVLSKNWTGQECNLNSGTFAIGDALQDRY